MSKKRGQAAMEFLITYSWAILAAIIAIAILAYFGVFNPGKISGDRIILTSPFHAVASQLLVTPAEINFEMSNRGTKTVTVNTISIIGDGPSQGIDCTSSPEENFIPDILALFTVPCSGTLAQGETYIGNILITYTKSGGSLQETASGKIKAVVQ